MTLGRSFLSPSLQDAHRQGFDEKLQAYGEVCRNFRPVFRYFCMERFLDPAVWMEKRLAYTRSVATSSIGTPRHNLSRCAVNILSQMQRESLIHGRLVQFTLPVAVRKTQSRLSERSVRSANTIPLFS